MDLINAKIRIQLEHALQAGDMFALFEHTRTALASDPDDAQARYLQALAMARLGEPNAAMRLYDRNRVEEIGTEDAVALKGRILKDLAVKASGAEQVDLYRRSSEAYGQANKLSDGYFSAINAATTAFLAGDGELACQLADAVRRRSEIRDPGNYYEAASQAEATLVCGEVDAAIEMYAAARRRPDANPGMIASTARQVGLIADRMAAVSRVPRALMASIKPPPVFHFCGHMWKAGWSAEPDLVAAVERVLDETEASIAYGALACGGDLIVAEAVIARGGELHAVLPFAEEDFLKTSVAVGGEEWVERYHKVKEASSSFTFASQMRSVDDDGQFAYCSSLVMGLARLRAGIMSADTFQLALWDRSPARGLAGTAADCAEWERQGGQTRIVEVPRDRPPLTSADLPIQHSRPPWSLRSILFADFAGFSSLDEDRLSQFLEVVMGRIARVLDAHANSVLCRNSWGDAIFTVITSPAEAAMIALAIQSELDPGTLRRIGLPADGGMRISVHHGPVFEHFDAVQGMRTYYGTEVTVAARIEPRVPVGSIYATQPFAALIEAAPNNYHFEFVGKMDLAKNYGVRTLYRLIAEHPVSTVRTS
jgi:adenylate cyclase